MRGYGRSSRPSEASDYGNRTIVADLTGVLDSLDVEKAVFVGHDFGAQAVWSTALHAKDRVSGVVSIAHANDDLRPEQMLAASSVLVLVFGVGAATGPILVSFAMDWFNGDGFFGVIIANNLLLGSYGLYRLTRRDAVAAAAKTDFKPMPIGVTVPPEALEIASKSEDQPQ